MSEIGRELARLRAENDLLRAELAELRVHRSLRATAEALPAFLRLSPWQTWAVAAMLDSRAPVSWERLMNVTREEPGARSEFPTKNSCEVLIGRLRKTLAPHGAVVRNCWGLGWTLDRREYWRTAWLGDGAAAAEEAAGADAPPRPERFAREATS